MDIWSAVVNNALVGYIIIDGAGADLTEIFDLEGTPVAVSRPVLDRRCVDYSIKCE